MTAFRHLGAGVRRDIAVARQHCDAMRALVMRTLGGREDRESLGSCERSCEVRQPPSTTPIAGRCSLRSSAAAPTCSRNPGT